MSNHNAADHSTESPNSVNAAPSERRSEDLTSNAPSTPRDTNNYNKTTSQLCDTSRICVFGAKPLARFLCVTTARKVYRGESEYPQQSLIDQNQT